MVTRIGIAVLVLAALVAPDASDAQQRSPSRPVQPRNPQGKDTRKVYTWTDSNGLVHYGDSIPPEYANRDRDLSRH